MVAQNKPNCFRMVTVCERRLCKLRSCPSSPLWSIRHSGQPYQQTHKTRLNNIAAPRLRGTCLVERKPAFLEVLVHEADVGAVDDGRWRVLEGREPIGEPAKPLDLEAKKKKRLLSYYLLFCVGRKKKMM